MVDKGEAVILLSGGMDSAVCLAVAQRRGYKPFGLTFDYGQQHAIEVAAAKRLAEFYRIGHCVVNLDAFRAAQGSALLNFGVPIAQDRLPDQVEGTPTTYVPARNFVFLAHAISIAEARGASVVYFGATQSVYPDCQPDFVAAAQHAADLATDADTHIHIAAPLLGMSKIKVAKLGKELGVPFELTHSCYRPDASGRACQRCDACMGRQQALEALQ